MTSLQISLLSQLESAKKTLKNIEADLRLSSTGVNEKIEKTFTPIKLGTIKVEGLISSMNK